MSDAFHKDWRGVCCSSSILPDYLIIFVKDDMMRVQFSKYMVLKITCDPSSIPDLLNKDSEIAALKFGFKYWGKAHVFSGRAKIENHWATFAHIYNHYIPNLLEMFKHHWCWVEYRRVKTIIIFLNSD